MKSKLQQFKSESGASVAIEYAITLPLFLVLIFGILEYALIYFSSVAIERSIVETTRLVKIKAYNGGVTEEDIRTAIRNNAIGLLNADKNLFIATELANTNASPTTMDTPERCLRVGTLQFDGDYCSVTPPFCKTDYFLEDLNGNSVCTQAGSASPGGPGSIVRYAIYYDWKILTPLVALSTLLGDGTAIQLGGNFNGTPTGVVRLVSGGAIRNEY